MKGLLGALIGLFVVLACAPVAVMAQPSGCTISFAGVAYLKVNVSVGYCGAPPVGVQATRVVVTLTGFGNIYDGQGGHSTFLDQDYTLPAPGTYTLTVTYTLTDTSTGTVIEGGKSVLPLTFKAQDTPPPVVTAPPATPAPAKTATPKPSATKSPTPRPIASPAATDVASPTPSPTATDSPTPTTTPTFSESPSETLSAMPTPSDQPTTLPSGSASPSPVAAVISNTTPGSDNTQLPAVIGVTLAIGGLGAAGSWLFFLLAWRRRSRRGNTLVSGR